MSTTELQTATGAARLVGSMYTPDEEARTARSPRQYQSVCVPRDGSPASEHALPVGRSLARRLEARLCLVHVHRPGSDRAYTGRAEYAWRENEQRCEESRYLWSKVNGGEQAPATAAVLMSGRVAETLLRFVREQEADLLVMTTHGAGGAGHPWLGSVADRVLRSARMPVVLTPVAPGPVEASRPAVFRRVLIPLDGSGPAEEVIEHAVALGELCGASYLLLQVESPQSPRRATQHADVALGESEGVRPGQAAQRYLDYVATRLRDQRLTVDTRVIVDEHPAAAILAAAQAAGTDLIALTLHGESGKQRRLFGSIADKIIRGTQVPLLVYRPRGGRAAPRVA